MKQKIFAVLILTVLFLCSVIPVSAEDATASPSPDVGLQFEQTSNGVHVNPGSMVSVAGDDYKTGFDNAIFSMKTLAQFLVGICAIFCIVCFCRSIVKMNIAGATGHVLDDKGAVMGLLLSGVGIALFGGLELLVSFAWDFLAGI